MSGRSPISPSADSSISLASFSSVGLSTEWTAVATIAASESGRPVLMGDRSYGTWSLRARGAVVGVAATGAGLAAGELLVGSIDGAVSPVIAVGNKVIDLVPLPLKNWAVETFGTSDKVVLVVSTLVILFVAGIVIGTLAVSGRRPAAFTATAVIGLLGVGAVLTRPDPTLAKVVPIVVGTLVSVAALWWLSEAAVPQETEPGPVRQAIATVGAPTHVRRSSRR